MAQAQEIFRISGKFSVKARSDSASHLSLGHFYYEHREKLLIYELSFPQEQTWVFSDTSIMRFAGDSLLERQRAPAIADFSVFNLALQNKLSNYGLAKSLYELSEVEQKDSAVISTWRPPEMLKDLFGAVYISAQNKKLRAMVFTDPEGKPLRKQFIRKYQLLRGVPLPVEILDILYFGDEKSYQITVYEEIKINDEAAQSSFRHRLERLSLKR